VRLGPAHRLLVPRPIGPPARHRAASPGPRRLARHLSSAPTVAAQAATLPAEWEAPPARQLEPLAPVEEWQRRGSLYLADVSASRPFDDDQGGLGAERASEDALARLDGEDDRTALVRRLAYLLQLPAPLLLARDGPLAWPEPLLPYQLAGVRELLWRDALLLADDMGLGKTVQAVAALRILAIQRRVESALLVVPAGLIAQWRAELHRWAPELRLSTVAGPAADRSWQWRTPAHVYLTSYETLRADFSANPHSPVARPWDLVVLDEAQRIKNAASEVSRACKRLRRRRQWALTGTPLENSLDDVVSILDFVSPPGQRRARAPDAPTGLREILRRVQLRRRKADVLRDLPPKLETRVALPLVLPQRVSYDRAEQQGILELRAQGEQAQVESVLELIVRLKQICNFCPTTGASSKLDDLRERVATLAAQGHKALVFTQFANVQYGARAIAARLGVPALAYTGDLSPAAREAVLHRFRTDPTQKVLVLSLRAGGQGLNLQEASYVFHFDRWWNPAVEDQAEARSHRLGQSAPVNVYTYVCSHTIEERIDGLLHAKHLLFDEFVDGVSIDLAATLTSEELFGLFGLPAPG
jgi:SNF2 family DNA or RNA helicase